MKNTHTEWSRLTHTGVCLLLVVSLVKCESFCPAQLDGSCKQNNGNQYKQPSISDAVVLYSELKQMLADGKVQLFDVREPNEFEAGAIPAATNIPLSELEKAFTLTAGQFTQLYGVSLPSRTDSDLIVHCQKGRRSLTALEILERLGYNRARHYAGGYSEWVLLESQ